ncbi:VOC family protein [Nocardia sp. XZ_19_231]|uniref:VOC family protein n=1 Tax=Nocardia sp. XZ_19_231 TaxID=2769252 RepID=UPI00188EF5D3|nr:VOC family protein [Nocardia sp. XZ_19_231]
MSVRSLNHAVLFVSDVERSAEFYIEVLGFEPIVEYPRAVFLRGTASANDHDLGLLQANAERPSFGTVGLYHLAWEVETLAELAAARDRMQSAGALTGAANHAATKAIYGQDPDGIEFEVTWLVPDSRIAEEVVPGVEPTRPLDLDAEIARYGERTPGGPRTDRHLYDGLLDRLGLRP